MSNAGIHLRLVGQEAEPKTIGARSKTDDDVVWIPN